MECRSGCAACCVTISISSVIPGMPDGKPPGMRCIQLNNRNECILFGKPERPQICSSFLPSLEMCGETNEHAFEFLSNLEKITS